MMRWHFFHAEKYKVLQNKKGSAEHKWMSETPAPSNGKDLFGEILSQKESDVKRKFSLSSDSEGTKLTKEQSEYFKDSKMRDDNGNLTVMYHGSQDAGFHEFTQRFSDDGTSFFFVDSNTVAKSYSGTNEAYTAKTFRTAEDFNRFFAEIGATEYEVAEKNGTFSLLEDGDEVAANDSADAIYDEFRDWTGLGTGSANYKVYLNLKNPLVVDAKNSEWDEIAPVDGQHP
ncbi:MAG: hypothetical protein IJY42_03385 [Clostridia bacterium]|nr:hypothetical protein [Clostridia bacterium]